MTQIEVRVPVTAQSVPYYNYLVANYRSLAKYPEQLSFFAHFMDGMSFVRDGIPIPGRYGSGSSGHAYTIESILACGQSSPIRIIADADTVMLMRNWDEALRDEMTRVDCVGTTYESMGGYSSGNSNVQTYKNKPNLVWFATTQTHDTTKLRCFPAKDVNIRITTQELSDLYQVPIGYQILCDVGWQIPQFIHDNAVKYTALPQIKPTSQNAVAIKSGNDYHEEYHLHGVPFNAHQRGSMKHPFRRNELSSTFYDVVEAYVKSI
jgi:hypothetical protein